MAYEYKECRLVLEQCFTLAVKLDKVCTFFILVCRVFLPQGHGRSKPRMLQILDVE